jgi:hypothetical protein
MPEKSIWDSTVWKTVIAVSVILAIFVSVLTILQLLGNVDIWSILIVPMVNFFTISIPLFSVPLTVIVILIALLILGQIGNESNILDNYYARGLAIECQTPRTTEYLHRKFDDLHRQDGSYGGSTFESCMKLLENQGYLKYRNDKWEVTQNALTYIDKYHGG